MVVCMQLEWMLFSPFVSSDGCIFLENSHKSSDHSCVWFHHLRRKLEELQFFNRLRKKINNATYRLTLEIQFRWMVEHFDPGYPIQLVLITINLTVGFRLSSNSNMHLVCLAYSNRWSNPIWIFVNHVVVNRLFPICSQSPWSNTMGHRVSPVSNEVAL